jgi:hypothetical protein
MIDRNRRAMTTKARRALLKVEREADGFWSEMKFLSSRIRIPKKPRLTMRRAFSGG